MEQFKIRHKKSGRYWNGTEPMLDRSEENLINLYFNDIGFNWTDIDRLKGYIEGLSKKSLKKFIHNSCEIVCFELKEINKINFI